MLDEPGEGEGDFVLTVEMLLHDFPDRIWDAIDDAEVIKTEEKNNHHTAWSMQPHVRLGCLCYGWLHGFSNSHYKRERWL